MKKLWSLLVAMLLVASFMTAVVAQDDAPGTNLVGVADKELGDELENMADPAGAEVRLENLNLSLANQIEHAKDIVAGLEDGESKTALEEIIISMELLQERVEAIEPTGNPEDMAAEFVAIKNEAIDLSKEFRDTLRENYKDELEAIREEHKETKELRKEEAKAKLEELKERAGIKRIVALLEENGYDVQSILDQLEAGEISLEEAHKQLRAMYNELSDEEKESLREQVRTEQQERKAEREQKREETRAKLEEKRQEMKAEREQKMEERKAEFESKMAEWQAKAEERRAELEAKMAEWKAKADEKQTEAMAKADERARELAQRQAKADGRMIR